MDGRLLDVALCQLSKQEKLQKVSHYLLDFGCNVDRLKDVVPMETVNKICAVYVGKKVKMTDSPCWSHTPTGSFSTKSAYWAVENGDRNTNWKWSFIWSLSIPPRVKSFLWLVAHGKILSNQQRYIRGRVADPNCVYCGDSCEDFVHILCSCPIANNIWTQLGFQTITNTNRSDFYNWFESNLKGSSRITFAFTSWQLWKWRCLYIFEQNFQYPPFPAFKIKGNVRNWNLAQIPTTSSPKSLVEIKWIRPPEGKFKLNTDCTREAIFGKLAAGGILRDDQGFWRGGFTAVVGCAAILDEELWSILHGLKIGGGLGVREILVESNSSEAVALLKNRLLPSHRLSGLISAIQDLGSTFVGFQISHVYREQNMAADCVAKLGLKYALDFCFLSHPPADVVYLLDSDLHGPNYIRLMHS